MGTTYKDLLKLYDVIQNGNERTLENLLKDTTQINQILPCKGIGVLHLAVGIEPEEKSNKCTELLLKRGADPNLCNEDGVTPVHIAAIWGRLDNLKLLIGCGGDPARRDIDGHSAFDYATREEQWEVFDYLHNVVDEIDDSFRPNCAYTFELERVILTTDQIVAEYGPIDENAQIAPPRKSELIHEWCDKNSLTINKLYPTILGETYLIENESARFKSTTIEFANNITLDLTKDRSSSDTNASFKSCMSKKLTEVEISGVQRLENTLDETKPSEKSNILNNRISVYENFSLPGSPKTISHTNYNTKSSVRKKQCSSLISSDCSEELDKVLAIVQNKTNEYLSCSKSEANNTRRSSASSGVSSHFSGGSIVLANVQEEYKYEDKEENVIFIEKRLRISPVILPIEDVAELSAPDQTIVSVASSLPASVQYDDNTLRAELIRLGYRPGPIQDTTRNLYLKKLQELKKETKAANLDQLSGDLKNLNINDKKNKKTYSIEIEKSLRNAGWMSDLQNYIDLENKARIDFADTKKKWREGTTKNSFTYLLLDPRVTKNLPATADKQNKHCTWITFIESIFYVGKGKCSRPYHHLYQAETLWKKDFKTSEDRKIQHILDIWSNNMGVVCLQIFHSLIPVEAYTYEAAMIDALGLTSLKNLKIGTYYGIVSTWPLKERRMLGVYLLYKAMLIFLSEGERQLGPEHIKS